MMGNQVQFLALASLVVAIIPAIFASGICPDPADIRPCTCDGEGVNCWHAQDLDTLRRVFRVKFPAGGIRGLWIQDTSIRTIPRNLFNNLMIQKFNFDNNQIEEVESGAFNGSQNTALSIIFFNNQLKSFPWHDLQSLRLLETLNLAKNQITSIPDDAFGPHRSLNTIQLTHNKISYIGKNAFLGLPNLSTIDLSFNELKVLGPLTLATNAHLDGLQVNLMGNQISKIDGSAFHGTSPTALVLSQNKLTELDEDAFLPIVSSMARVAKGIITVDGNPLTCQGCEYEWIHINMRILQYFLRGFECTNGKTLLDIDEDSIDCDRSR